MELYAALLLSRLSAHLAVLAGYAAAFQGIWAVAGRFCKQFQRTSCVRGPGGDGRVCTCDDSRRQLAPAVAARIVLRRAA